MVDKYLIPNIALTTMLIMIARPEREWSGDAECDMKYLIPNTTLTNFMSLKRVNDGKGVHNVISKGHDG